MLHFLIKGLLRDRHRSLVPFVVVSLGVFLIVLAYCYMHGAADEVVRSSAKLDTGHVKITTRGYRELASQLPNDLALRNLEELRDHLEQTYPHLAWAPRIKFGGLLDFPDEDGETRAQGPVLGIGLDLLDDRSGEVDRLQLDRAIVRGRLPNERGEIIVSEDFAARLDAQPGDVATLIGSTAYGALAAENFRIAGTIRLGITALDRNTILADIADVQYALDMENAASEILGFFPNLIYLEAASDTIAAGFNDRSADSAEQFAPVMETLREQGGLGEYLDLIGFTTSLILGTFFFVMSIMLWKSGLMSGIRRYGEIGVRLAIGEAKTRIYAVLLAESIVIGLAGSVAGTAIGLGAAYYLQVHGIDITSMTKGSTILMANIIRARITPPSWYIGFLPGLLATLTGTAIAGIAIFKRQTAQLFKELEG
jgi:putative ABC transport system permease protein